MVEYESTPNGLKYGLLKDYYDKIGNIQYGLKKTTHKHSKKLKQAIEKLEDAKDLITDLMSEIIVENKK